MILSILATVAVLAAIAAIAAALVFAETALVYIALGLGGVSVLLLAGAMIQGRFGGDRPDRERSGTDGLGKSSVPVAVPAGPYGEPEHSGRVPAPVPEPVREVARSERPTWAAPVTPAAGGSERGEPEFDIPPRETPAADEWPRPDTEAPDPAPAESPSHAEPFARSEQGAPDAEWIHIPSPEETETDEAAEAAVPAEPAATGTPFTYRIPFQGPSAADEPSDTHVVPPRPLPADERPADSHADANGEVDAPTVSEGKAATGVTPVIDGTVELDEVKEATGKAGEASDVMVAEPGHVTAETDWDHWDADDADPAGPDDAAGNARSEELGDGSLVVVSGDAAVPAFDDTPELDETHDEPVAQEDGRDRWDAEPDDVYHEDPDRVDHAESEPVVETVPEHEPEGTGSELTGSVLVNGDQDDDVTDAPEGSEGTGSAPTDEDGAEGTSPTR